MQDSPISSSFSSVTVLDGVTYAMLGHDNQLWRLGSTNPAWREIIGTLPAHPADSELHDLESQQIWLAPDAKKSRLAVMCCGLGSGWPGMGRELYDNFPEARKAMDELVELANLELTGFLDEPDLDKISRTSKQIPYLFLLEYAQWTQFVSLGLAPSIVCGHSLGELVALCLAGIYDVKAAIHLFERRAEHITRLEEQHENDTGLLAVLADKNIIDETLAQWPTLALANRNTSRQYILGGPKNDLVTVRKNLRKRRIPAMLLNVPIAFHNPAMRILRNFSLRRLGALEISAPKIPVISNITTNFYPSDKESIYQHIADLDENAVAWNECVQKMWSRDKIGIFLELGPGQTLCGLVDEIEPQSLTIAADHQGKETFAMRLACARLFALGHLDYKQIEAQKASRPTEAISLDTTRLPIGREEPVHVDDEIMKVIEFIAKACQRKVEDISLEDDLRHDLAIRSSSFPLLLQDAESQLGCKCEFESLLHVNTVADLAMLLLGRKTRHAMKKLVSLDRPIVPPFRRFVLAGDNPPKACSRMAIYKPVTEITLQGDHVVLFISHDNALLAQICGGLAPTGCLAIVPSGLSDACKNLSGNRIEEYDPPANPKQFANILENVYRRYGRIDGCFLLPKPHIAHEKPFESPFSSSEFVKELERVNPNSWLALCRRFMVAGEEAKNFLTNYAMWLEAENNIRPGPKRRIFALADDGGKNKLNEIGDIVALELMYGTDTAFWCREPLLRGSEQIPQMFADAKYFPMAIPDRHADLQSVTGQFHGISWFSNYTAPKWTNIGVPEQSGHLTEEISAGFKIMSMLQGAQRLLPWLVPLGFSDIFFHEPLPLPLGIARECRLGCTARFWFMHEKTMTRLVDVSLSPREISPNGRRLNEYKLDSSGTCLMGAQMGHARPLDGIDHKINIPMDLEEYYSARNPGPSCRLVEQMWFADRESGTCGGILRPWKTPVAMGGKADYAVFLHMFDSLLQAGLIMLANSHPGNNMPSPWRCTGVGYLNFDSNCHSASGDLIFHIVPAWRTEKSIRFNAQVEDSSGKIFLVTHNVVFDRVKK